MTTPLFYDTDLTGDDGQHIGYACCRHCTHPINRPMQHAHPLSCCQPEGETR